MSNVCHQLILVWLGVSHHFLEFILVYFLSAMSKVKLNSMKTKHSNLEMGKDNSGRSSEWPKPKKSKTSNGNLDTGKWELLPSVILHDIYSRINARDRVNASSTCHMWRQSLYHPKFWKCVSFEIHLDCLDKVQFLRTSVGHIVTHATVKLDSLSPQCVTEFLVLLQHFNINDNLKSFILEPSHCHIETPQKVLDMYSDTNSPILSVLLKLCCRQPLQKFSLGLNEALLQHIPQYLQLLADNKPDQVSLLGLASVKDDPGNYLISNCDPSLFKPFRSLQILSIDYDILSDSLLHSLQAAEDLRRLVIHVHGIWDTHPGTSEKAWEDFKEQHPDCFVRLSLIHAYDEVCHLEHNLLRKNMPLSHFKVLFCENVNLRILDMLSTYYRESLRSIMWVDSLSGDKYGNSWNLIKVEGHDFLEPDPDPLVILAWLCRNLEEITLIGYKYYEDDLIAIARLRNNTLKKLEIAQEDILYSNTNVNAKKEISEALSKSWAPLHSSQLHPVILDPVAGDSDEYILPYLLADLH